MVAPNSLEDHKVKELCQVEENALAFCNLRVSRYAGLINVTCKAKYCLLVSQTKRVLFVDICASHHPKVSFTDQDYIFSLLSMLWHVDRFFRTHSNSNILFQQNLATYNIMNKISV